MRPTRSALLVITFLATLIPIASDGGELRKPADVTQAAAPTADAAGKSWFNDLSAIANADADAGRRAAIARRLDALGITWREAPFDSGKEHGVNLWADVAGPADAPLLLLGAHSDQVAEGEGATDNASGSATVLDLARRLKERPLAHHRVAVAFWDLEEKGLLGSKAFVASKDSPKPVLYVNFDVFGWGDTVWLMSPTADGPLVKESDTTASAQGLKLSSGDKYPPTDHLPFLKAGWPAVSYSLVGGDEIALILEMYAGKKPSSVPKVMKVIHSDDDTLAHIDAAAAKRGVDAVEAALRAWDASAALKAASR